jgi:hypothetical protein
LILRSLDTRVPVLCFSILLPLIAAAQLPPATSPPKPTPPPPAATPPAKPAPAARRPSEPDYPDRRTFTIGIFDWVTLPGTGPDIKGGFAAAGYETLNGLGKDHPTTPGVELSLPVTRTGEFHVEGFISKGDGTQIAPATTTLFTTAYSPGDFLSTQYQIRSAKIYYEDLLWPFKFPVAKFRLHSLWEAQWLAIDTTIDAPLKALTTDSSSTPLSSTARGARTIILPKVGIAAEYALAPHVLLRASSSGFGLPHRADLWDADATVSWRHGRWEILGGFKALHFKSSPKIEEYISGTIQGGYVGIRWHL